MSEGYELMNALNAKYRFVKWVIDRDGDIHVEFDMLSDTPPVILGDLALEAFLRMVKIADDVVARIAALATIISLFILLVLYAPNIVFFTSKSQGWRLLDVRSCRLIRTRAAHSQNPVFQRHR